MIEVKGFENEVIQQEQRSIEEKLTMFVTTDNNDLVLLTKNQNTLKALQVTNQEMQEESFPQHLKKLEGDKS